MEGQYILSICIPTYNRAIFLNQALARLLSQQKDVHYSVEYIISDNTSTDDTEKIVNEYIQKGLTCRYVRNSTNIGPDRNFVQCFNLAQGRYIWLIGDDDYLNEGAIEKICKILSGSDEYGLVHVESNGCEKFSYEVIEDNQYFFEKIGVMITFMSGNIINSKVVEKVNPEEYYGSFLIQMPYFIRAAIGKINVYLEGDVLDAGHNAGQNGGYNFAQVFIINYLSIWKSFVKSRELSVRSYARIKKSTYLSFLQNYVTNSILGRPCQSLDMTGTTWQSFVHFWHCPYYWQSFVQKVTKHLFKHNN